jgi:hypothetical protein
MPRENPLIVQVIRERRRLRFVYDGKPRLAEPPCYGIGQRGTELLRVHPLRGGSRHEALFDVARIEDLVLLEEHFAAPGPHYRRGDSAMAHIFCEL